MAATRIHLALLLLSAACVAQELPPAPPACAPDCHCLPDVDGGTCPPLGARLVAGTAAAEDARAFFAGLAPGADAAMATFDPPGCQPFPLVAAAFGGTPCDGVTGVARRMEGKGTKAGKGGKEKGKGKSKATAPAPAAAVQCAFEYEGPVCRRREYSLVEMEQTSKSGKSAKDAKGATHTGSCGVCSSAQDLATNLSPTVLQDSGACSTQAAIMIQNPSNFPTLLPSTTMCYQALGFSDDCAFLWASNSVNILMELSVVTQSKDPSGAYPPYEGPASCVACHDLDCSANPLNPACLSPTVPGTCDLAPCVACDEEASGPVFLAYAGRIRRNSGIVGGVIKRPCAVIADIDQPDRSCDGGR